MNSIKTTNIVLIALVVLVVVAIVMFSTSKTKIAPAEETGELEGTTEFFGFLKKRKNAKKGNGNVFQVASRLANKK